MKNITHELCVNTILMGIKDDDKCDAIECIIQAIMEDGIIDEIRELVNNPKYDDR